MKFVKDLSIKKLKLNAVCLFSSFLLLNSFGNAAAQSDFDFYYLSKTEADLSSPTGSKGYIPASVVKIITASHALFTFGENFKFATNLYLTNSGELVIEGAGDPSLTSENLKTCISRIIPKIKDRVLNRIIIDNSKYSSDIEIPGSGTSNNPYDAAVGAISVNFNSVSIRVKNGKITSGESETPLTEFARKLGSSLKEGAHRISIKGDGGVEQHFSELVTIFLKSNGIKIKNSHLIKKKPEGSVLIGQCLSSDLSEVLVNMLKYSNNYSANQIYLNAGARYYGFPAELDKSRKAIGKFLELEVGIDGDYVIDDGAGLSKSNRITPKQLIKILKYFEPSKDLLPESSGVFYKSGTLTGVYNLAGYIEKNGNTVGYFALFGKQNRTIPDRVEIVKKLALQYKK